MKKDLLDDYSWVVSGSQRTAIIKALTKPKTPKMISQETSIKFSNVSDCLKNMIKIGLAVCLNPKRHLGRLYELTKKGEAVRKELTEN